MPAIDLNATYQPNPLDLVGQRPSIKRTGSDIRLPPDVFGGQLRKISGATAKSDTPVVVISTHTPWLNSVLASIVDYRKVGAGWDGRDATPPTAEALDSAEMLSVFINGTSARPTFSVDPLGRPTFSLSAPDFYLHLTVDDAERLTWFADIAGEEYFADDQEFTGRSLPKELAEILSRA